MGAFTAIISLALACSPREARADGDPASDVLALQTLFLPQDARVPASQKTQLAALLQAAGRSGYQIRAALIASPTDLGSVTELWSQPQTYAQFLGEELSLVYRGRVLVIMPAGFGVYDAGQPVAAERSALAGIRISPPGAGFGMTALSAIQRLAAASGHSLSLPGVSATVPSNSGSTHAVAWIVFVLGGALVVLAWTASLRARPVQLRGKGRPSI